MSYAGKVARNCAYLVERIIERYDRRTPARAVGLSAKERAKLFAAGVLGTRDDDLPGYVCPPHTNPATLQAALADLPTERRLQHGELTRVSTKHGVHYLTLRKAYRARYEKQWREQP